MGTPSRPALLSLEEAAQSMSLRLSELRRAITEPECTIELIEQDGQLLIPTDQLIAYFELG